MITVNLPDGTKLEFPNGTPPDVMREAITNRFGGAAAQQTLPPSQDAPGGVNVNPQAARELVQNLGELDGDIAAMAAGARDWTGGGFMENVDAAVIGGLLGGTPDGATGVDLLNYDQPTGERYAGMRDQDRARMDAYQDESPLAFGVGNAIGGVISSVPFAPKVPPTAGMREVMRSLGLFGATEGAVLGAGTGDGETMGDVATDAALGALVGGPLGMAAVPAVAAVQRAVTDPLGGVMGAIRGVGNPARAGRVVSRAFQRSGQTLPETQQALYQAAMEGQDVFRTADALGNPGQRMLAGVARSPGDGSREITEWLNSRQMGQNERVSSFVADAIDTPQTANARQLQLQAERRADASANYGDARMEAQPVDVRGALSIIDDRLGQISAPGMGATVDMSPIDRTLQQFRARLAVPSSRLPQGTNSMELSDFSRVFEVKKELDGAIGAATRAGDGFQVQMLTTLRNTLDDALAEASPPYSGARDTYRQQSQVIDAVDQGRDASRAQVRTQDALDVFNSLAPQQTANPNNLPAGGMSTPNPQDGFRVGYVDPLLARLESAPPGTDVSRQFTTPKTQEMLNAISDDPELLARRIARERQMFDTRSMATGGSPTANLLQDIADVGDTSPNLAQMAMNPRQAIIQALGTKAGNFINGTNEQTRQMIARVLMSADPQAELAPLLQAAMQSQIGNRSGEALLRQMGYQALLPSQ